jgi:N-dimethylarginine dimethylaminohydrolase
MPILMCPPTHYAVEYEINPWMHVATPVDSRRAGLQWDALRSTYRDLGVEVVLADPVAGLPDMVFTANAGVVHGGRVMLSRFRHAQRRGEESRWRDLFASWGVPAFDTGNLAFEGAGDALFLGETLVCGHGFRTDPAAIPLVAGALGVEAVALELVDPRFYHLDTCFCPLDPRTVLFAPAAFSPQAREAVHRLAARVIEVPDHLAAAFVCNAMAIGDVVISSMAVEGLNQPLRELGYRALGLPMGEFIKAGGGVRCLSLPVGAIPGR